MDYKKQELFESELKLLKGRERHPYLHHLIEYLNNEDLILDLGCGLLVNLNYLKNQKERLRRLNGLDNNE